MRSGARRALREDLAPDDDGLRGSAERARVREVKVTLRRVDVRDREWAHPLGTVVRLPAWPALAHVEPAALAVAAASVWALGVAQGGDPSQQNQHEGHRRAWSTRPRTRARCVRHRTHQFAHRAQGVCTFALLLVRRAWLLFGSAIYLMPAKRPQRPAAGVRRRWTRPGPPQSKGGCGA